LGQKKKKKFQIIIIKRGEENIPTSGSLINKMKIKYFFLLNYFQYLTNI
jgi:hypothetical protein